MKKYQDLLIKNWGMEHPAVIAFLAWCERNPNADEMTVMERYNTYQFHAVQDILGNSVRI